MSQIGVTYGVDEFKFEVDDWHYFIGDADDGQHVVNHVLCWSLDNELASKRGGTINVTLLPENVTCQQCLEWLHA
jgi:hypothetical protein